MVLLVLFGDQEPEHSCEAIGQLAVSISTLEEPNYSAETLGMNDC
jgi:hypothetical protein